MLAARLAVVFVEGEKLKLQLVFTPPSLPMINLQPGDFIVPDAFGLPAIYRPPTTPSEWSLARSRPTNA